MKRLAYISSLIFLSLTAFPQTQWGYIPSNRYISTLEKNLLFNAVSRYQVTIQGTAAYPTASLNGLFDGKMAPLYTSSSLDARNPIVIEISGLPNLHTQTGAWIGLSTRWWPAKRFKVEGYNTYNGANTWLTIADVSNNNATEYLVKCPSGTLSKLRFTFYEGASESSPSGRLGVSEIFFIHPEASYAYDGLMVRYDKNMNVGIGTSDPQGFKLAVNGSIRTKEVVVTADNWPDYVFQPEYHLRPLQEVEAHIHTHGHLPEVPSAQQVEQNGVGLAEMNALLLKKVEELTLYMIELKKEVDELKSNK